VTDPPALADIPYDSLVVGRRLGPYAETVSAEMAARLAGPIGASTPAALAPPAVFPVLFLRALRRSLGGIPAGSVLAKQELEFHAELPVEREVQITVWVGDKQVRRGRPFVTIEFAIDAGETPILTGRKIIVWPSGPGGGR
jgi:hypothetical protein